MVRETQGRFYFFNTMFILTTKPINTGYKINNANFIFTPTPRIQAKIPSKEAR